MDRLDSMFFNHSDQTATQRPGSGDGGEVFPPTPTRRSPVPPSPSRLSWMGSQEGAFPSGEECPDGSRVDSRISGVSIRFDEEESTDVERNRYFRPGRFDYVGMGSQESTFLVMRNAPMVRDLVRFHLSTPNKWFKPMVVLWSWPCVVHSICDVIKQNESELANTVLKIQPNKANSFLCFWLFVQSFSCLYLRNQLPNFCGVFTKLKPKQYPNRKCQKSPDLKYICYLYYYSCHGRL